MKKFSAIIFIFFCISISKSRGQTMILQVDRATDSIPATHGPNLKKFVNFFLFAGFVTGADEAGARIKYFSSAEVGFGVRWKYKISPIYSTGFEWRIDYLANKLVQKTGKYFPDTILNDRERMDFTSLQLGYYSRFNFDSKRGNFLGYYLDIGVRGEWDFGVQHITKNDLPDGSSVTAIFSSLPFVNSFNYSVFGRVGLNKVLFYASYRLSDLFKSNYHYPELPKLTAGIELSIFRQ
jgi:hypothetical protein